MIRPLGQNEIQQGSESVVTAHPSHQVLAPFYQRPLEIKDVLVYRGRHHYGAGLEN